MNKFLLACTASFFAFPTATALAQGVGTPVDNGGDIVVTATRQSTLLSKTPIAMTAVTGEGLLSAGITDARALADAVPNLAISENGDAVRISIRGVTSSDTTEKGDPSAAFLLDGVYIARPADVMGSFYDLERVEVLRGPQGTLYGRNTTAGVVNVISAKPKDAFEASVNAKYGNLNSITGGAMVNVPVGAGLAVRAAVNYDRQDNNLVKGVASDIPLNPYRNLISTRLSFGGTIGDDFDFVIRGDYSAAKGTLTNALPLSAFYAGTPTVGVDPLYVDRGSRVQRTLPYAEEYANRRDNEFYGIMGEFTYDFGPAALTYLGSYRKTDRNDVRNLYLFSALNNPATFQGSFKQQSHELRAAFGQGNPLHGQAGVYYFREESALEYNLGAPLSQFVGGPNAVGFAFPQGPTISRSRAAFGQVTYDVTPDLHLTGGLRYTNDFKSRNGATVLDMIDPATKVVTRITLNENIAARTFNKLTWKAGFDYDAQGLGLIYGSVSTGYKAGGFNDGCVTGGGLGCGLSANQLYYNPETLTAYEGGVKFKLLDNALRLNLSAFHYDYKSLQLSQATSVGGVPQILTQNAGTAKVDGFEFEALMTPSSRDSVEFTINFTDARYDSFTPSVANGATLVTRDFKGLQLDHAPKWSASAGYTHSFPLGNGGKVDASARTRFSSAYYMQDLSILAQFRQPAFTKTDLTLGYKAPEDRWFLQGFVKNLENEITLAAAVSGIGAAATIEEPRTYGVRAGFNF